jgi:hypothetical protein
VVGGGVVYDQVGDHPHSTLVCCLDEGPEVLDVAIVGVDRLVVGDVVAAVAQRARVHRQQPDAVDPEPLEVVELLDQAAEVAGAVVVAVEEPAQVNLIEDGGLEPERVRLEPVPGLLGAGRRRPVSRSAEEAVVEAPVEVDRDNLLHHQRLVVQEGGRAEQDPALGVHDVFAAVRARKEGHVGAVATGLDHVALTPCHARRAAQLRFRDLREPRRVDQERVAGVFVEPDPAGALLADPPVGARVQLDLLLLVADAAGRDALELRHPIEIGPVPDLGPERAVARGRAPSELEDVLQRGFRQLAHPTRITCAWPGSRRT